MQYSYVRLKENEVMFLLLLNYHDEKRLCAYGVQTKYFFWKGSHSGKHYVYIVYITPEQYILNSIIYTL